MVLQLLTQPQPQPQLYAENSTLVPTRPPTRPPLGQQVTSTFASQISTALTAVAVLSWTDAIKSLFGQGGYLAKHATFGPWIVAVAATFVAIIGTRLVYSLYPISIAQTPAPLLANLKPN